MQTQLFTTNILKTVKNIYYYVSYNKENGEEKLMRKESLIDCFNDTVSRSQTGELKGLTEKAVSSACVYKENFSASYIERQNISGDNKSKICVVSGTTFDTAQKYTQFGRTAVLNFANPQYPGGGVSQGAMAQEECLCRSSNLYLCLNSITVFEDFYFYHKKLGHNFFSDRLIYTRDVTVFKDDSEIPELLPNSKRFCVDVITCAAPYIAKRKYTNKAALKELFKSRIKNIFEAALDNGVTVLVLGAFGCGAFGNPPEVVAEAFHEVIDGNGYEDCFNKIVFAIKPDSRNNSNFQAFDNEFSKDKKISFSRELPWLESVRNKCESSIEENFQYFHWKEFNRYYKKQFSILGDSISTLVGYNPKDYRVYYENGACEKSGVKEMRDTWWGKVIDFFGGELLVNNSWSGSRVTKLSYDGNVFPSGCSPERTGGLHINGIMPDVIIVNMGINDWANAVKLYGTNTDGTKDLSDLLSFDSAYITVLSELKRNYPQAEIWCCTLGKSFMSSNPQFVFPPSYGGIPIDKYNEIIRAAARENGCRIIDLALRNAVYDTVDGIHPNAAGMDALATAITEEVLDEDAKTACDETPNGGTEQELNCDGIDEFTEQISMLERFCIYFSNATDDEFKARTFAVITNILSQVPLLFPMEIDAEAFLNGFDPAQLKPGDVITPSDDFRLRIKQLDPIVSNGVPKRVIPMFTSTEHMYKYYSEEISGCRMFPCDYLPTVISVSDYVILNPDDSNALLLPKKILSCLLMPRVIKEKRKTDFDEKNIKQGTVINGKYEILKHIGRGGIFEVYLARDTQLNLQWAVKISHANTLISAESIVNKAEMQRKLNHPMIPKIADAYISGDRAVVIEEYVCGSTLEDIIKEYGAQPADTVIDWVRQICYVIGYLHSLNPIHIYRDIKPANFIIDPSGRIRVIDFGIMRTFKPGRTEDTCSLGTKGYAAPEQFGGRGQTDPRTDIYEIGITMYRLLTGNDVCERNFILKPITLDEPGIAPGLAYIMNKCTRFSPRERYISCEELLNDLSIYNELPPKKGFLSHLFKK